MTLTTGWKGYASGFGLILFAITGYLSDHLTPEQAIQAALAGLGIVGVRHAIS